MSEYEKVKLKKSNSNLANIDSKGINVTNIINFTNI